MALLERKFKHAYYLLQAKLFTFITIIIFQNSMAHLQPRPRKYSDNTHERTPHLFLGRKQSLSEPVQLLLPRLSIPGTQKAMRVQAQEETGAATDDEEQSWEVCSMWRIDFQSLEDIDEVNLPLQQEEFS